MQITKDESKFTFSVLDAQTRQIVEQYTAKLTDIKSVQELILSKNGDEYSADLSPVASYMLEIEAPGYAKYINRIEPNSDRKKDIQLIKIREAIVTKPVESSANTAFVAAWFVKPSVTDPVFFLSVSPPLLGAAFISALLIGSIALHL